MFQIDPDIRRARTPPSRLYTDPQVFELQKERIFARSWQWAADAAEVRVPGAVHPFLLLPGCLDEPLLLTRDARDVRHCVSNVCTHRGNLVCEHAGVENALRCRYHGRRFALDGSFQHMPEFENVEAFPDARDSLARVSLEALGPLLFASLAPAEPFADWMRPVHERVAHWPLNEFRLDPARSRDYLVRCNWALYCENYLEGFHIPFVHASLNQAIDYGSYRTELFRTSSLQVGVARGSDDTLECGVDEGGAVAAYYFWLWPNLMLNFYPWGLSVNVIRPQSVDRTRVSFLSYVWRPERLDRGAGADLDRVEREDESIVEAVQRGLRGRLYENGRYSPSRETGTHHFHGLLAAALA